MRLDRIRALPLSPNLVISASLALAAIAISALVVVFAHARDVDQTVLEQRIVSSAIKDSLAKLGDALAPNAYWDAAYDELDDDIDPVWAGNNLGPYAQETSGVAAVLVYDHDGEPIYEFFPGDPERLRASDREARIALRALTRQARANVQVPPFTATGFMRIGNTVYLGAASLVVPNDERAGAPLTRNTVEVYLREFDASSIAKVETDFGLSGVKVEAGEPTAQGLAFVTLHDAAGAPVAHLVWRATRPGQAFALAVLPIGLAIIGAIGLLQVLALQGWQSAVSTLERKKVETARLKDEIWGKTMFLANMSHELRTPLNAVIGFSEIIAGEMLGPVAPRYKNYAKDIYDSGSHLLSIVNDVLDLTKLQNAEHTERTPIALGSATETALKILKEQAERAGVALQISSDRDEMAVLANEKSLNQILLNLGSNAIKFSEPGSCVKVIFEHPAQGRQVQITVADEGCGIPKDKLPMLGQPFYQVQNGYARKAGTGLGLAIVKTLVDKLGGDFKIESQVGVGTRATVTLQAHRMTGRDAA